MAINLKKNEDEFMNFMHEQFIDKNEKKKIFIVHWCNGEQFAEDIETEILAVFSNNEKAESYAENWRDDYRKQGEEFFKNRGEEFDDEDFKYTFPEFVYIMSWDLQ